MTAGSARVRLRQVDVAFQELDGHVVLLDLRSSNYIEINPSGAVLFDLLVDGADEGTLAGALQTRYGLEDDHARHDVVAFLRVLEEQDLLEAAVER